MEAEAQAVGIDLGTTYSSIAVWYKSQIKVIENEQGKTTTPSYVAFTDGYRLIGTAAKNQVAMNSKNTVFDSKRLIGRKFDDPKIQDDLKNWPFNVVADSDNNPRIEVQFMHETKLFTPEEISSMVLIKMKETAERFLRKTVKNAVITVPAYFNNAQRQATKDAGQIAGLNVLRIINEPTAAALAYGLQEKVKGEETILVYDLGGGTFDVSIIKVQDGTSFDVLAVAGDNHLGGEDFDNLLVNHFATEFQRQHRSSLRNNPKSVQRLRTACERAKRTLSTTSDASIEIDNLFDGKDFCSFITRARFELLCKDLFAGTIVLVEQALREANLTKNKINAIVMVGGSSRIPQIQKLLNDFFNEMKINFTINPDEAVAYGAAVQAAILTDVYCSHIQSIKLFDVVPLSLGISTSLDRHMTTIIPKQSKIPCNKTEVYVTMFENQSSMKFSVFEGERKMTADNNFLGEFRLNNLTPAPRGLTKANVIFDLNADGILEVTAQEIGKENIQRIQINRNNSSLKKSDVDRMLADAIKYKEIDEKHEKRIAAMKKMDDFILKYERALDDSENLADLTDEEKSKIRKSCSDELEWLRENLGVEKEVVEARLRALEIYFESLGSCFLSCKRRKMN